MVFPINKYKTDGIYAIGSSAKDVTGSCLYVKWRGHHILIECGMYQSNDILQAYNVNKNMFANVPMNKIEAIIICHFHGDHQNLLPLCWKLGFGGKVFMTQETYNISKDMMLNSASIVESDAKYLSNKFHRKYTPLYDGWDVATVFDFVVPIKDYNTDIVINDNMSFKFHHNTHCIGASSISLTLRDDTLVKRVYYSSDLGAIKCQNHFVSNYDFSEYEKYYDVAFIESTYGDGKRDSKRKRSKDLEMLDTIIRETVDDGGKVIIPSFAAVRTQEIMYSLYSLYHNDDNFKTQILVDSPLAKAVCADYRRSLYGSDLGVWESVLQWDKIKFVNSKDQSLKYIDSEDSVIVIGSSGFCTNGRIVEWLKNYLDDENSSLVFVGYVGGDDSYLAHKIKNADSGKMISVNGKWVENNIRIHALQTFSSHANCNDLVEIGSNLNCGKIVLHHGSDAAKQNLKDRLECAYYKKSKSTKVVIANQGMFVKL